MEKDGLSELVRISIVGKCFSKAILDDYCDVISVLTKVPKNEIRSRIVKKAMEEQLVLKKELDHLSLPKEIG